MTGVSLSCEAPIHTSNTEEWLAPKPQSAYFPTFTLLVQAFALAKSLLNLLFSGPILLLMTPLLGLLPEEQNDCGWIK